MQKRMSEMTPEEKEVQREKWREEKQAERAEKKRQAYVPTADEWADEFGTTEHAKTLDAYVKQFFNKVVEELGRDLGSPQKDSAGNVVGWDNDEEYTVDRVARTLFGLKKNWVQEVRDPNGEMIGGLYFIDDCSFASELIESAHRHGLKKSQTFSLLYRELLEILDKRYGHESTYDARAIKAELAGEYVLSEPSAERKQAAAVAAKEL